VLEIVSEAKGKRSHCEYGCPSDISVNRWLD